MRGVGTGGEPTTKTRQARVYVDALDQITNANFIYLCKNNTDNVGDAEHSNDIWLKPERTVITVRATSVTDVRLFKLIK